MNTITSDPGQPGGPPGPRPAYPPYLLMHDVMRILVADGCEKISVTTEEAARLSGSLRPVARPRSSRHGRSRDPARPEAQCPEGDQRRAVERARELAEAAATVQTLAAYLGVSTQHPGQFFYATYRAAIDRLRDLLASLDQAGAGQADPGGDPPHAYIPAGPVEAAPYEGYCPPEVRREAFAAVLEGVEMGAYDSGSSNVADRWDDPTCRTIASLLWRCRLAGRKEGRQ